MEGSEMAPEGMSIYCTIIFYDETLVYGRRKIKTNEILPPTRMYCMKRQARMGGGGIGDLYLVLCIVHC